MASPLPVRATTLPIEGPCRFNRGARLRLRIAHSQNGLGRPSPRLPPITPPPSRSDREFAPRRHPFRLVRLGGDPPYDARLLAQLRASVAGSGEAGKAEAAAPSETATMLRPYGVPRYADTWDQTSRVSAWRLATQNARPVVRLLSVPSRLTGKMMKEVHQDVLERVRHLRGRAQDACVVVDRENAAVTPHDAVQRLRDTDAEALHAPASCNCTCPPGVDDGGASAGAATRSLASCARCPRFRFRARHPAPAAAMSATRSC